MPSWRLAERKKLQKGATNTTTRKTCDTCGWPDWQNPSKSVDKELNIDELESNHPERNFQRTFSASTSSSKPLCLGCAVLAKVVEYIYETNISEDDRPCDLHVSSPRGHTQAVITWADDGSIRYGVYAFTLPGCPRIAGLEAKDVTSRSTFPSKSLPQLHKWLSSCQQHKRCTQSEEYIPPRLIDVGNSTGQDAVKLVETADQVRPIARYICLSHCWGDAKNRHITLTSNIDDNRKSIPIQQLPLTFQHAIQMTRHLGVQYLWIDSLCIVQDDSKDWIQHVPEMESIYRNAYLTLAAGASRNSHEGLFREANSHDSSRNYSIMHDSIKYEILVRRWLEHGYRFLTPVDKHWPLMQRGWVYQEHMLSRRFVTFAPDDVTWVCREERHCICESQAEFLAKDDEAYGVMFQGDTVKLEIESIDLMQTPQITNLWGTVVECYSSLQLTKSSDKLPAIAGLARHFKSALDDEYISGHWRKTLKPSLAWHLSHGFYDRLPRKGRSRLGPSWAWTSAADDGTVMYREQFDDESLSISSVNLIRGPGGEFLDVAAGCLCLDAVLLPVSIRLMESSNEEYTTEVKEDWHSGSASFTRSGHLAADFSLGQSLMQANDFLRSTQLLVTKGISQLSICGLIVTKCEPNDAVQDKSRPCFARVGFLTFTSDSMTRTSWKDYTRTKLNLV